MNTATNALPGINIGCLRNRPKIRPMNGRRGTPKRMRNSVLDSGKFLQCTRQVSGDSYVLQIESAMRGPLPESVQQSVQTAQRLASSLFGTPVRIEAVHYSRLTHLAHYDPGFDVIRISTRWEEQTEFEQVLALFHEMRHRAVIRYGVKPYEDFSAFRFLVSSEREAKIRALVKEYYDASEWVDEIDACMLSEAVASILKMKLAHLPEILKKLLFSQPEMPFFGCQALQTGSNISFAWWDHFSPNLKEA